MPLFYQQNINPTTKLAIWRIEESEDFFNKTVPLQKEITHPHKRLQHLAGRFLLPYLFPNFPYEEILIADTKKPFLPNEQFHFSISHCADYAAVIVSKTSRVGIDIELVDKRVEKIASKFLGIAEQQFVQQYKETYANNLQLQLLTLMWSTKEAVFKWWGNGNVDFSKDIFIKPFELNKIGNIEVHFKQQILHLQYALFNKLCLVWLSA